MKKRSLQYGFTLVEMLLYMGLLGMFISVMSTVFQEILQTSLAATAASTVQQDGKYLLARIGYDVRRAKEIVVPTAGQTENSLTLLITEDGQDVEYTYSILGSGMVLSLAGTGIPIQSDNTQVTQASFMRIGNSGSVPGAHDTIQVTLDLESIGDVPRAVDHLQFQTTYSLR